MYCRTVDLTRRPAELPPTATQHSPETDMSDTSRRDQTLKPADQASSPADPAISDLNDQVKADDAEKVRGGLNPQPLPPRYGR